MFLSVKHIERDGLCVERVVRPGVLSDADGRVIPFEPASLEGLVAPRRGGFRFSGRLLAAGTFECARCLEPFRLPIEASFDLFYTASAPDPVASGDSNTQEEALAFTPLVDEKIDLTALVSEQIYLNLPLKPLCAPECRGLCVNCGANRNLHECSCRDTSETPASGLSVSGGPPLRGR